MTDKTDVLFIYMAYYIPILRERNRIVLGKKYFADYITAQKIISLNLYVKNLAAFAKFQ